MLVPTPSLGHRNELRENDLHAVAQWRGQWGRAKAVAQTRCCISPGNGGKHVLSSGCSTDEIRTRLQSLHFRHPSLIRLPLPGSVPLPHPLGDWPRGSSATRPAETRGGFRNGSGLPSWCRNHRAVDNPTSDQEMSSAVWTLRPAFLRASNKSAVPRSSELLLCEKAGQSPLLIFSLQKFRLLSSLSRCLSQLDLKNYTKGKK